MQLKMNDSEPLPITMPFDKYKEGVRDFISFSDKGLPGYTDLKDVFDFITSDDKQAMVQYQSGDYANYLPTKKFKIAVNADDVLKNGVITPDQKSRLTDTIKWTYTENMVMKDRLAMLDILTHNNWKRPICFTTTVGPSNFIGLQPYLYKEGFTYRLIPFKPDTSLRDQLEKSNTMVMYNNVMNKFKFGNFKNARFLDHESTTMFYPVMMSTFLTLAQSLMQEGHPDLALKVMHKYDEVMPNLDIDMDITGNKYLLTQVIYQLHDTVLGNKYANYINNYVVDQLDYNYYLLQKNSNLLNTRSIRFGLEILNGLAQLNKDNHQAALANKFEAEAKGYETKFAPVLAQAGGQ